MKEELILLNTDELNRKSNNLYFIFKRFFDFTFSLLSIILLFPFLLIIFIFIKLDSKGPAIYKHERLGKNGQTIGIYKFRTMVANADEYFEKFTKEQKEEYNKNFKLENDPRITKVGKILRNTSLDELPQLLNILKGEMSIIGPRPVVKKEILKFGKQKDKYLSVLPGLTGWWGCNGRSDITYEDRIKLELYYIDNISFKLDVICFFKTISAVLKKSGAK